MRKVTERKLAVYQAKNGAIKLHQDFNSETIWASQKQLADFFGVDVRTVNEHIKNVFKINELEEGTVIRKFRITATDGKNYNVNHYNLDMIISVGYRVNSKTATQFRKWATKTLKKHITKGYTINKSVIAKNYDNFLSAVETVQKLLPQENKIHAGTVLDLVKTFSQTWLSLESYDEDRLPNTGATKKKVTLDSSELYDALSELKQELIRKKEATELFAQEKKEKSLEGILGNVMQSAFGGDMYKTIEEKAVHLLYFIVKNHVFNDGNKRSGAFAFVWFLERTGIQFKNKITPEALTAITLLVAESDPKDKSRIIGLLLILLKK